MSTTSDTRVCEAIEAEARRVMAQRCSLKREPGTHGEQAEMLEEIDYLLDLHSEAAADDATNGGA